MQTICIAKKLGIEGKFSKADNIVTSHTPGLHPCMTFQKKVKQTRIAQPIISDMLKYTKETKNKTITFVSEITILRKKKNWKHYIE